MFRLDNATQEEREAEERRAQQAADRAEIQRRAAEPLTGNTGNLGQGELFSVPAPELFSPPNGDETT